VNLFLDYSPCIFVEPTAVNLAETLLDSGKEITVTITRSLAGPYFTKINSLRPTTPATVRL
jgi:hypothetical protein